MASGKAIGTTLVLGGGGATAGAAMGGAFSSSKEQTDKSSASDVNQVTTPELTYGASYTPTTEYQTGLLSIPSIKTRLVKPLENKDWWNKAFTDRAQGKNTTDSDAFKHVNNGFSTIPVAAPGYQSHLNQACNEAYKKPIAELQENQQLLNEIKKYCSLDPSVALELPPPSIPTEEPSQGVQTFSSSVNLDANSYTAESIIAITKKENRNHLVKDTNDEPTKKWWAWSHHTKYPKTPTAGELDPHFQGVEEAYSDTKPTALNKKCDAAYKKLKQEYSKDLLIKNISKFCAKGTTGFDISEPQATFYETGFSTTNFVDGVLTKAENLPKLVKHDVSNSNNDLWFNWAYNNVVKGSSDDKDELFNNLERGYQSANEGKSLRKACEDAYKKTYWSLKASNEKLLNNIKKFCTPGKEADTTIALPVWKEPTVTKFIATVVDAESASPTKYTSNFAKHATNKTILVDPEQEEEWWSWVYENTYKKLSDEDKNKLVAPFLEVEIGKRNTKSLSNACKTAYNYTKENLAPSSSTEGKNKPLELIKKFCVPKNKQETTLDNSK